jgi:hypothetical protein
LPATQLTVIAAGHVNGLALLIPTGPPGPVYAHVQDWVTAQRQLKRPVKDISAKVLVKGMKQWAVFEQRQGAETVRTVFKIT